jgi:serine/threonine-protein kinase HipA
MDKESVLFIQLQSPSGEWIDVGLLRNRDEKNWFEFIDSYWDRADRPVLGQIFEEQGRRWEPNTHVALPRWFSHLLPEGRLRDAVARAADVNSSREFELIMRLGTTDLPGAVRAVTPAGKIPTSATPAPSDDSDEAERDPLLKFSLAGAQLKFSIYGDERGLTIPATGQAGNFILKFPDGRAGFDGVPEAELASLELARAIGIDTPKAKLVDPADVTGLEKWAAATKGMALAVERFDRRAGDTRVHMEELAQVLNIPTARERAKYKGANFETVAIFVGALAGVDHVGDVIDRIVLNVLVGNGDAHLKNWAFLYPDGKHPALSPVYDILPTVLYIPNDGLGLNLRRSKQFAAVTAKGFEVLGARSGYGSELAKKRAKSAVEKVLDQWPTLEQFLKKESFQRLSDRLKTLQLVNR